MNINYFTPVELHTLEALVKRKEEIKYTQHFHVCFSQLLYGLAELLVHFVTAY